MKIPVLHNFEDFIKKEMHKHFPYPKTITIDVSNNCNAACPFCTRQISSHKLSGFMSKEMFYNILEQVKKIKKIKYINLASWGEPLLHPNIDEFIDVLKSNGYSVGFPTNFSLAHKHFETLLKVDNIMISIEGHDKESYNYLRKNLDFEKTLDNLKTFDNLVRERKKQGLPVPSREINFLINKKSKIKEFVECYQDYVDLIAIRPMFESFIWDSEIQNIKIAKNEKMHNDLFKLTGKKSKQNCSMPFDSIYIRANGKLFLCCSDYDIDIDFGNYNNLLKTWKTNKNLKKVRKDLLSNNKQGICTRCFQNFELPKEIIYETFPELKNLEENNSKIKVYTLR